MTQRVLDPTDASLVATPELHPTRLVDPAVQPLFATDFGAVYNMDCLELLRSIESESVEVVFADPPFNLGKVYGPRVDDLRSDDDYFAWCTEWLDECHRILKPGGAMWLYNVPRWNIPIGAYLMQQGMTFRHWVAVDIKLSLPIRGRLYPSHYSLLYFTKGKPATYRSVRTPIDLCRHCDGEIKDYGGHRDSMNPLGVNLSDVWADIPPVRHWKFKSKKRATNQLSTKLVQRALEISSRPGATVVDPFGGAGTTFHVAEETGRYWLGSEIESCDVIVERLTDHGIRLHEFRDWVED